MTVQQMVVDGLAGENAELREALRLMQAERDGYRMALLSALDRITWMEKAHKNKLTPALDARRISA